ncbi:MAG: ABC transporter substrate-binding protein [Thermodesulfobacteriota bacterium]|nr:ABC transporter substrate-binding protein [Thermodesulfobacteriota bacterium]
MENPKIKERSLGMKKIVWMIFFCFVFLGFAGQAASATKKGLIKIGMNMELTGMLSEASTNVSKGARLYLDKIGHKVAGRDIEIIEMDSKSSPKVALEVQKKLVEMKKVHLVAFGTHSPSAIAIRDYSHEKKVPTIIIGFAGTSVVSQVKPSPYIFRTSYGEGACEVVMGRYAHQKLGFKKIALMTYDYAGALGKIWPFQRAFEEVGGKILQEVLTPMGVVDFAPYLANLNPKAEALFAFFPGNIACVRFISQLLDYGILKKMSFIPYYTMTADYMIIPEFRKKVLGFYSSAYYAVSLDNPENNAFKKAWAAKYPDDIPTNIYAATGYRGMKAICAALETINGNSEDTAAFIKAMGKVEIDDPCGGLKMDKNGVVIQNIYIREIKKVDGKIQNVVLDIAPWVHEQSLGYTIHPKMK